MTKIRLAVISPGINAAQAMQGQPLSERGVTLRGEFARAIRKAPP